MAETNLRRLMRQDERQAQILGAAATAFARGGFAAISMDDVAAEAGITRLIVYRHFASKEALYRAILQAVTDRLRDEFLAGLSHRNAERGWILSAMLKVARENPDGFRLLAVHAAREPQFVTYHDEWWAKAYGFADSLIGKTISDATMRAWATRTTVAYVVDSVLAWLEAGRPDKDGEFVDHATDGLIAMYLAWSTVEERAGLIKN